MNNLRKFATEADYSAATLNYPAVSWVVSGDTVHFDKTGATVNNKVKLAFTTDVCGAGKTFNVVSDAMMFGILEGVSVNGVPVATTSSSISIELEANTNYLIEYELASNVNDVSNWFNMAACDGCSCSDHYKYDILFPAQVTSIGGLNQNGFNNLILEPTTPPSISYISSELSGGVYVPDSAVNTYKNAEGWNVAYYSIYPISQYSGNIPT